MGAATVGVLTNHAGEKMRGREGERGRKEGERERGIEGGEGERRQAGREGGRERGRGERGCERGRVVGRGMSIRWKEESG